MTLGADQRTRLLRTKLAALAAQVGLTDATAEDLGASVALVGGGHGAVLVDEPGAAAVAGAVLWAVRRELDALTVFTDSDGGRLARWAAYLQVGDRPIQVRTVQGGGSVEAAPDPVPVPPPPPSVPDELLEPLRELGVEIVVEHGVVRGEVLGLEVARLVPWPVEVGGDGELHLEAGVGRFDRDAVAAVRPDEAPAESLRRTVEQVRVHRHPGAGVHPVQLLARERWLRSIVVADPTLVGAAQLTPVGMTTEPEGLRDTHPAAALGIDADGGPMLVVCSRGVDLALVPLAADTRAMLDRDARLVLALPARDHHVATTTLVGQLREPAEVVELEPGWS